MNLFAYGIASRVLMLYYKNNKQGIAHMKDQFHSTARSAKAPTYVDSPSYRVQDDPWYKVVLGGAAFSILFIGFAAALIIIMGIFS